MMIRSLLLTVFAASIFVNTVSAADIAAPAQATPQQIQSAIQTMMGQQPAATQSLAAPQQATPQQAAPQQTTIEGQPASPRQTADAPSEIEQYLSGKSALELSTDIKQFGYDLFKQAPSTFAPVDKVPVGPDYVIGPGDEIRIMVWGKVEGQWTVVVDRNGNISLPKAGVIGVTGLSFKELKELLYKELSKYYTGFEMNVGMGSLRTIMVYIMGNAKKPGAYTISSLSTIITALFEAGGPSKVGTMRDIQVKRGGKTVVHFDMYDFLLKGDKTNDIRLMPEDVIFIPIVGNCVGVAGNVKRPGIYEVKDENRLLDLLDMVGGISGAAFKGRVQVQRIDDHQFRTLFEGDLIEVENNREKNFVIKDGDLIKIYSVFETKNTMSISGAVANPGDYGVVAGVTRIKDIISWTGGLLYFASNQAELTRVKATQSGPETGRFAIDLSKAMAEDPKNNLPLEVNDYLIVRAVPEWQLYRKVSISGEVRYPGAYTINKGERLSSLIERAGGFIDKAYLRGVVFTRESVRQLQQKNLSESIDRLEQQMLSQTATSAQTAISPEDLMQQKAAMEQQKAVIAKMKAAKALGRMVVKLDTLDKFKGGIYDIELEEGDSLFIPEQPTSVQVMGSVYNSTAFVYEPSATISSSINKAGGTTKYADEDEVFVLKVDGSAVGRRQGGMFFMSSKLDAGDTVVVPEKVERIAWMRDIKDLTQILYQIAVSAAVVIKLF